MKREENQGKYTSHFFYIVIIKASHWCLKAILNKWVHIHHLPVPLFVFYAGDMKKSSKT